MTVHSIVTDLRLQLLLVVVATGEETKSLEPAATMF